MRRRVTLTRPGAEDGASKAPTPRRVPKPTDSPIQIAPAGEAAKPGSGQAAPRQKRTGVRWQLPVILSLVFAVAASSFLPYLLVAMVGLAPTWIAMLTTPPAFGARTIAIAEFNLAGTLPFLATLAERGGRMDVATALLGDVFTWAIMLGAAAMGMGVIWACPRIAVAITRLTNAMNRGDIERDQQRLLEEWGEEVATSGAKSGVRAPG